MNSNQLYEVYLDESKGYKDSFQIFSLIFGEKTLMDSLQSELDSIKSNNGIAGEFKANKNNKKNLSCAKDMLTELSVYISQKKIGIIVFLVSEGKMENNAGFLRDKYKIIFETDANSPYHYTKLGISLADVQPIIHRATNFFPYIYFRDYFGPETAKCNYYPDAASNVLNYNSFPLPVQGKMIEYYSLLKCLCNATIELTHKHPLSHWSSKMVLLNEFKTIDSKSDSRIQACDMISNYFLNKLRAICGITKDSVVKKASVFDSFLDISELDKKITDNFSIVLNGGQELIVCNNDDYAYAFKLLE